MDSLSKTGDSLSKTGDSLSKTGCQISPAQSAVGTLAGPTIRPDMENAPPIPCYQRVGWWSWCRDHFLLILAIVFFAGVGSAFMANLPRSEWGVCFVRAALRMQAGQKIHVVESYAYAYPPAMAMLAVPLANLPPRAGMFGWYLVNVLATTVTFVSAWRLAGGPSLVRLPRAWQAVLWIGMLLSFRFFLAPLTHQQFDMVIAALLLAGCCRIWRGHDLSGAALIGASAAMKCTPLLFAPYLLWRGKLRAAGLLVVLAIGLNLLPDLLWPRDSGRWYLADWTSSFLGVVASKTPGTWHADFLQNQSLSALFGRIAQFGWPLSPLDLTTLTPAPVAALPLRLAVYGTGLLLLAATAWISGRPGRPAPTVPLQTGGPVPFGELQIGAEAAAVLCLMLLLSPMSSKSHYVVTLLPSFLIVRAVVERRSRWLRWLLIPLVVCGPLTTKGLIGKPLGDLTLIWGLPVWYALISLVGVWMVLAATQAKTDAGAERPAGAIC